MTRPQPVVAIIGAGNVLPAYLRARSQLVERGLAVAGPVVVRRPERAEELLARWPGLQLVATTDVALATEPDIVVVLTPPAVRPDHVRAALRAGSHVLVEKPTARSVGEAIPLYDTAERSGLRLIGAPFTHLSPTVRELLTRVDNAEIGSVHSARALYGNRGAPWAAWHRSGETGPCAEVGIYSLRTLTALLGPVSSVVAAATGTGSIPHTVHFVLTHQSGAVSSVVASHAVAGYRRPAVELYAECGSANLLGDDWDPSGLEILPAASREWRLSPCADPTWHWTAGLADLVHAVRTGRAPLASASWDLHLLETIEATERATRDGCRVLVGSTFTAPDLRVQVDAIARTTHDHSRPPEDQ